ncbi:MAG: hypothetical protein IH949_05790 [Bacteroidetes bacterium]|nr:hypothetical protein [Bacteroidota bacterium]
MNPSGDDSSKITNQTDLSYSQNAIKRFLSSAYADIKFPDSTKNPLDAIAFSGPIIFKQLPVGADSTIIKSIQDDIKKANRKSSPYKSLIYISNDSGFEDPTYKHNFLSKIKSTFTVEVIPYSFFTKSLLPNLDSPDLIDQELLNKHNRFLTKYRTITPILVKIFNYVYSLPLEEHPPPEHAEQLFLRLDKKIKANFHTSLQKDVHNDVLSFWQNKMIIESFIKQFYNQYRMQFDSLKSRVINSFLIAGKQKSDDEVNDILVFNSIAKSILPPELIDDYDALDCAKALVYYFFEYCLFGNKSEYDDPTFNFPVDE